MGEENGLLSLINGCCFGGCYGYKTISAYDLLLFTLGSFVLISILLFYYNRIPKSNSSKSEFENPIYQSKDILLQSNNVDANFLITEKTTSTWVKFLVYILIVFVVIVPVNELFSAVNSFY